MSGRDDHWGECCTRDRKLAKLGRGQVHACYVDSLHVGRAFILLRDLVDVTQQNGASFYEQCEVTAWLLK